MKKNKFSLVFSLLFLIVALFGGSSLFNLGTAATVRGMYNAGQGQPGTAIFQSKDQIVFVWSQGSQYAYAAMGQTGESVKNFIQDIGNGTAGNPKTISELLNLMLQNGFRQITPEDLPPEVLAAVGSFGSLLLQFTRSAVASPVFYLISADPAGGNPFAVPAPRL